MRKFLIFCFFFLFGALIVDSAAAQSYKNPDGSQVNIEIPAGLPTLVASTLDVKIKSYLPTDFEVVDFSGMGESQNPANWEYDIQVKKIYENENIISLLMTTYQYAGGAHGSSARFGMVIEKSTGKRLEVGDIFQSRPLVYRLGPVWRSQILAKLRANNGNITSADRLWVREGTVDDFHYNSFVLTDKLLIVYGQEYQHNAYAFGMQTLIYPLARLADIRK